MIKAEELRNFVTSKVKKITTMEITLDTTAQIMELSLEKFKWKPSGQIDKVDELFDDELF
jgi:hypothetical protein